MLKTILSPAKKMNVYDEYPCELTVPVFLDKTNILMKLLKEQSLSDLQKLWQCSDKLAQENYQRLHTYHLSQNMTPALLAYEGIQYQYISPSVFSDMQWEYVNRHLKILSGFYGILRPTDGVIPYRLEMQAKLKTNTFQGLYAFWGSSLYEELSREGTDEIINLASAEYSKAVLPYIPPHIHCVTCIFGEMINGKVKVKATRKNGPRRDGAVDVRKTGYNVRRAHRLFLSFVSLSSRAVHAGRACIYKGETSLPLMYPVTPRFLWKYKIP